MKERPILFNARMVRALLAGTKTQTRRALRVQPTLAEPGHIELGAARYLSWPGFVHAILPRCPYGAPGDRLWVRESLGHGLVGHFYAASADDGPRALIDYELEGPPAVGLPARRIPSIHMPRWASRITLEVTGVRVERLQAISEADAIAEGCITEEMVSGYDGSIIKVPKEIPHESGIGSVGWDDARDWYADLWDAINGEGAWDANPWVWCVGFKRLP